MFRRGCFADVSLSQWMALTPPELVPAHLNLDDRTMRALPRDEPVVDDHRQGAIDVASGIGVPWTSEHALREARERGADLSEIAGLDRSRED